MAKKLKRHPGPSDRRSQQELDVTQKNSGEVVTVAWMLSLLAALIAEVLGILSRFLMLQVGTSDRLQVLSGTLLLVAVLAGLCTLLLTPVTLKLREVPPPRPIVVSAIVIGLIPLLTVTAILFR